MSVVRPVESYEVANPGGKASIEELGPWWARPIGMYVPIKVWVKELKGNNLSFRLARDAGKPENAVRTFTVSLINTAHVWGDLPSTVRLATEGTYRFAFLFVTADWATYANVSLQDVTGGGSGKWPIAAGGPYSKLLNLLMDAKVRARLLKAMEGETQVGELQACLAEFDKWASTLGNLKG